MSADDKCLLIQIQTLFVFGKAKTHNILIRIKLYFFIILKKKRLRYYEGYIYYRIILHITPNVDSAQ